MRLIKTKKQIEAIELISGKTNSLLEGGSRSGKTFIIIYSIIVRALHYPNTWHIALRLRFNHAKKSLWLKTIPDVLRFLEINDKVKYNNTDFYVEFPNGSRLYVDGLDDKDRVEKILGNEYATIYINEASQVSFDSYEIIKTRLNPPKGVPPRLILDYNPPSKAHWGYKIFHELRLPSGLELNPKLYGFIKMNPYDNIANLSESYIKEQLETLSGNKRARFLEGEYTTEEGALWKRSWFKYKKLECNLVRIAVGVDPSGSKRGDMIGIIVVGLGEDGYYYVLDDYSLNGTPKEWADEVYAAYTKHNADVVAAEKNYGGEMVESTITQFDKRFINVKLVNATRGKMVRAEPVSALYEQGKVFHVKQLPEYEDELVITKFDNLKESPNRLDAGVWAFTELAGNTDNFNVRFI